MNDMKAELELTFTEEGGWGMTFDWTKVIMDDKADDIETIATVLQASGEAERVGVKAGDVVMAVGDNEVEARSSASEFKALLVSTKQRPCVIRVARIKTSVRSGTL
jgi:hypothetical protein